MPTRMRGWRCLPAWRRRCRRPRCCPSSPPTRRSWRVRAWAGASLPPGWLHTLGPCCVWHAASLPACDPSATTHTTLAHTLTRTPANPTLPPPLGAYLEGALSSGAADPATYEQELARIYLQQVLGSGSGSGTGSASASASGKEAAGGGEQGAASGEAADGPPPEAAAEYGKLKQLVRVHSLSVACVCTAASLCALLLLWCVCTAAATVPCGSCCPPGAAHLPCLPPANIACPCGPLNRSWPAGTWTARRCCACCRADACWSCVPRCWSAWAGGWVGAGRSSASWQRCSRLRGPSIPRCRCVPPSHACSHHTHAFTTQARRGATYPHPPPQTAAPSRGVL